MRNIDYCIVGGGYAGLFFAHQCILNGKSFLLFDKGMRSASKISAGMVNPVVLKKFNTFWLASEQIEMLTATMQEMKCYLGKTFFVQNPIYRIFHDPNEELLWLKKRQRADLTPFLSDEIHHLDEINNLPMW